LMEWLSFPHDRNIRFTTSLNCLLLPIDQAASHFGDWEKKYKLIIRN
jgi:hypothetical protein